MKNANFDIQLIKAFIDEFGFGILFSKDLQSTHLPLLFETNSKPNCKGHIYGHMAKNNGQAKLANDEKVSVVFNGPHSYISPTWYLSRPAVSTWNYAAVHCIGRFEAVNSRETLNLINALIKKYEPEILEDKSLNDEAHNSRLLKAVFGFRIVVEEIQLIEKLGQHKKTVDQVGVFNALNESSNAESLQLAQYMKKRGLGLGR